MNSAATLTKPRLAFQTVARGGGGGRGGERQKGAQQRILRLCPTLGGGQARGRGEADGKERRRRRRGAKGRIVQ